MKGGVETELFIKNNLKEDERIPFEYFHLLDSNFILFVQKHLKLESVLHTLTNRLLYLLLKYNSATQKFLQEIKDDNEEKLKVLNYIIMDIKNFIHATNHNSNSVISLLQLRKLSIPQKRQIVERILEMMRIQIERTEQGSEKNDKDCTFDPSHLTHRTFIDLMKETFEIGGVQMCREMIMTIEKILDIQKQRAKTTTNNNDVIHSIESYFEYFYAYTTTTSNVDTPHNHTTNNNNSNKKHLNIIDLLRVDKHDHEEESLLNVMCKEHNVEMVKMLIEEMNANYKIEFCPVFSHVLSPIIGAALMPQSRLRSQHPPSRSRYERSTEIVRYLLSLYKRDHHHQQHHQNQQLKRKRGKNEDKKEDCFSELKGSHSRTLANTAIRSGNEGVIAVLEENGFDVFDSQFALQAAVESQSLRLVMLAEQKLRSYSFQPISHLLPPTSSSSSSSLSSPQPRHDYQQIIRNDEKKEREEEDDFSAEVRKCASLKRRCPNSLFNDIRCLSSTSPTLKKLKIHHSDHHYDINNNNDINVIHLNNNEIVINGDNHHHYGDQFLVNSKCNHSNNGDYVDGNDIDNGSIYYVNENELNSWSEFRRVLEYFKVIAKCINICLTNDVKPGMTSSTCWEVFSFLESRFFGDVQISKSTPEYMLEIAFLARSEIVSCRLDVMMSASKILKDRDLWIGGNGQDDGGDGGGGGGGENNRLYVGDWSRLFEDMIFSRHFSLEAVMMAMHLSPNFERSFMRMNSAPVIEFDELSGRECEAFHEVMTTFSNECPNHIRVYQEAWVKKFLYVNSKQLYFSMRPLTII